MLAHPSTLLYLDRPMAFPPPYQPAETRYDKMPYRICGRSGLKLPAISLGLWQNFGGADVFETGRDILRYAFDNGVTHFDLANNYGPPYGSAEENFGKVLATDFKAHRPQAHGSGLCRYFLLSPGRSGNTAGRNHGCADANSPSR